MKDTLYTVVVNDEGQYSIWPDFKPIPDGWRGIGQAESREACLQRIEQAWTDLRPFSLRRRLDEAHSA
jgi:MbtH protein